MIHNTHQIHSIQARQHQALLHTHGLSNKMPCSDKISLARNAGRLLHTSDNTKREPTHLHNKNIWHRADTGLFLVNRRSLTPVTQHTIIWYDTGTRSQVQLQQRHGASIHPCHWQLQRELSRIPRPHVLTLRTSASFFAHKTVQTICMRGNWRTGQPHVTPSTTAACGNLACAHLIQEALHELHDILLFIARENIRYVAPPLRQHWELRASCTPTEDL
jgi:hypothetical protein